HIADAFPAMMSGEPGNRQIDAAWNAATSSQPSSREFGFLVSGEAWRWLRSEYVPLGDDLTGIFLADITEDKAESALAALDAAVVVHAPDTSIIEANPKACELLGLRDIEGRFASDPAWVFLDDGMESLPVERYPVVQILNGRPVRGQLLGIRHPDSSVIWVEVSAIPRFDSSNGLSDVAVTFYDVTERENARRAALVAQRQLVELSLTDALTGLANRRGVLNEAERLRSDANRHAYQLACVVVDLDHLKTVNDRDGHEMGDSLICEIAQTIQSGLRADDIAGRIGGDEFLILLPRTGRVGCEAVTERIRIAAASRGCAASFGAAVMVGGETVSDMMRRADKALYRAKNSGGNSVEFDR
ncbi:MAG: sensor domain-containing diguanylate cyclase, partial [Actinobacteria bacterium]|nr:sensor domain-containing diguanylate cyclase [Actinomycetota bacterium]